MLIFLFLQKDNMNTYLSEEIKLLSETDSQESISAIVNSLYNYHSNKQNFQITFLEFGAIGCMACRKMEFVLEEVRNEYPERVKVIFLNILHTQNQDMMRYYGIAAIPTQVLLDQSGKEYFRHTGYFSYKDLRQEIEKQLRINK